MRWRQVVGLYVVLALLAAEYWLVERRQPPPSVERPARPRFLAMRPEEVTEIRLARGGRRLVSRRVAGRWTVVEPVGAPVPSDLIAAFTEALAQAEEIERVGGAEVDPAAYGLDESAASVEVLAGRGDPVVVTIGGTNPTGTAVYARRGGTPEIVLIGRNVRYYEDLILQALPAGRAPVVEDGSPVGRIPLTPGSGAV